MRFLVISDSHGRYERISELLSMHREIDALIFLGDGLSDLARAGAYESGATVFAVKGNCDWSSLLGAARAEDEMLLTFEGYRFLLMHGHTRGVQHGLTNAIYAAQERDADILLFGHTHEPLEKYIPDGDEYSLKKPMRIFNPGSLGASGDGWGYFGVIEIRGKNVLMSHGKI